MLRKVLILTSIVLVFSACGVQAAVIDSNWVGGSYGEWGNASNWNPAVVPNNGGGNTFAVTITGDVNGTEVILISNSTIDQLECYETVELFGGLWVRLTLEDANGLRNYGGLEISGEFEVAGNVTNYDYIELVEVEVGGDVTNTFGATLAFETPGAQINGNLYNLAGGRVQTKTLAEIKQGNIENAGLVVLYPQGQMMFENQFRNTGEIRLMGGSLLYWDEENGPGVLDNNSPGLITGFGVVDTNQLPQNKGTIRASGGHLLLRSNNSVTNAGTLKNDVGATLHIQTSTADVNNQGIIEINAGGAIVFDCNLVNEPNGVIELLGGTLAAATIIQSADANFAGFGSITANVFIDPNGIIEFIGSTNIVGDVNIPAGATLEISDGTTLITGHTTCTDGTIRMIGGRLIPQGGLTNSNCNIIWESGTYINMADFNLDGEVNFKDFAEFGSAWLWQTAW